jgi:hypothetical protein
MSRDGDTFASLNPPDIATQVVFQLANPCRSHESIIATCGHIQQGPANHEPALCLERRCCRRGQRVYAKACLRHRSRQTAIATYRASTDPFGESCPVSPELSPRRAKSTKCQPTLAKPGLIVLLGMARKSQYENVPAWDCKPPSPVQIRAAPPTSAHDSGGGCPP